MAVAQTSEAKAEEASRAGRGVLAITFAKLWFIVAGYVVLFGLPRLLGSPERFGQYSTAINIVSILNNVLIAATVQTVSKVISERPEDADARLRKALSIQLAIGGAAALAVFLLAPILLERFVLDPKVTPLLQAASPIVLAYALYAALVGALNGTQRFATQAKLDMTFSTMRTLGILGGAALGFGAIGAVLGFSAAACAILAISLVVVGVGKRGEGAHLRVWLAPMIPLWTYQVFLNGVLQLDLPVLKRTITMLATTPTVDAAQAADLASRYVGFYRAAQTLAFVPYQLILSVTFVVFPLVSAATAGGDREATRAYIRNAMRFSLLVLLAIAAPISGAARGAMRLAYQAEYVAGAGALSVLALGTVCFALFVIAATVLGGAGRAREAAIIAAVALVAVVTCNVGFVEAAGVGEHTLLAAALGTSTGMGLALALVGTLLWRSYGAFLAPIVALRAGVAGVAGWMAAHFLPVSGKLGGLLALAVGFGVYVAVLLLTREIGATEKALILRIVRRKRGG